MRAWPISRPRRMPAWRCYIAAKGLVTRARKDGSAEKIAAAVKREREAYTEFMAVSDAAIDEMFTLNRGAWTVSPTCSAG